MNNALKPQRGKNQVTNNELLPRTFYGAIIDTIESATISVYTINMQYVGDCPLVFKKQIPSPSLDVVEGVPYYGPYVLTDTERIVFIPGRVYEFFVEETNYPTRVERKLYISTGAGSPNFTFVADQNLVYFRAIPTKDPETNKLVDAINHMYPNEGDFVHVKK